MPALRRCQAASCCGLTVEIKKSTPRSATKAAFGRLTEIQRIAPPGALARDAIAASHRTIPTNWNHYAKLHEIDAKTSSVDALRTGSAGRRRRIPRHCRDAAWWGLAHALKTPHPMNIAMVGAAVVDDHLIFIDTFGANHSR